MPSDLTIRVAKATAAALAVVALAAGIWQVRSILILLLLAVTLAAAIRPGVDWLSGHRIPQSLGILLHFLVVGGLVALLLWLAVPPALHQIGHALGHGQTIGIGDRVLAWLQLHLHRLPTGTELLHPVATYGQKAGEAVVAVFFTLAATFYCVSERDSIIAALTSFTPESKRACALARGCANANSISCRGRGRSKPSNDTIPRTSWSRMCENSAAAARPTLRQRRDSRHRR